MEIKSNEATSQRPEGSRILDAPLLKMNLTELIAQIRQESTWAESTHNSITIFKSDTMRIVLMGLHENFELKPHSAKGVISLQVLTGKINFITGDESSALAEGQMIALHENIEHKVLALSESFLLLTLATGNVKAE